MLIEGPEPPAPVDGEELGRLIAAAVERFGVAGRRVLVVVPDRTRTAPIARLRPLLSGALRREGATAVTWMIALGTHRALSRAECEEHLGVTIGADGHTGEGERVANHAFHDETALVRVGTLPGALLARLSGGFFTDDVAVRVNAAVLSHDLAIVCGPVFPHEVVGFSGGNKYFFPGISGPETIDVTHWIGALATARALIGRTGDSPVRRLIDEAARQLPLERRCMNLVVSPTGDGEILGLFSGRCEEAFAAAARLSQRVHVRRVARPFSRAVAVVPPRYEDLWTAAKGFYKLEPALADGGKLVLYAPHVKEPSRVHGAEIARVGYHCRDFLLARRAQESDVPLSVLAHATHLYGDGTYDAATGTEHPRVEVALATGIDSEVCARLNLSFADPASVDLAASAADPDTLFVPDAGEVLYRLADDPDELLPLDELLGDFSAQRGGARG